MNLNQLINNADEGQLRRALRWVARDIDYWQFRLNEGLSNPSYANGVEEVVDNLRETITEELGLKP